MWGFLFKLIFINMSQKNQSNIFKDFNTSPFKKELPPKNDSEKTKKELEYLSTIDLDKKFFQDKDDLIGNFFDFLDDEKVKYDKKQLRKIVLDAVDVILELKNHFKRPRPFKLDHDFKDPLVKSTKGYSYPSGHSTQSNLLSLVLSDLYPKYKKDFNKIVDNIVFSRQMAKAHYPSDIKFGEKLAKAMFEYLKDNNLIKNSLKESIRRVLKEETEYSNTFKRRIYWFKSFIKQSFVFQYPCDFDNFTEFMLGVYNEIRDIILQGENEDGTPVSDWLTYDEGVKYVEEHMINGLKEFYYENCHNHDLYESKKIKFSSLFKRKFHIVDRLIDAHIDGMYTCDYADANEFFEGVIEEMSWMVRSEEFGLDDVDWLDIYDYLNEFKKEEILEYYTERCNDDNV
jgi:hypothetical protein